MIKIENLSKSYGETSALEDINLSVDKAELFGLIGPDGAGKTSLLRILTTLLLPNKGEARMCGYDTVKDYKEIRKIVGYMPGEFSLYPDLTVEENLNFFASVFNTSVKKNYNLIKDIYSMLEPFKKRRAGNLSGGMKQKLALSCALIHKPKILVLDEPTTGVDAVSRKEFWENLKYLKSEGITTIVSTPYMDEAELCDRIALMQNGKILSIDTPNKIARSFPNDLWAIRGPNMYQLLNDLNSFKGTHSAFLFGQYIHYTSKQTSSMNELKVFLKEGNKQEFEIKQISPNIEDCFMDLML